LIACAQPAEIKQTVRDVLAAKGLVAYLGPGIRAGLQHLAEFAEPPSHSRFSRGSAHAANALATRIYLFSWTTPAAGTSYGRPNFLARGRTGPDSAFIRAPVNVVSPTGDHVRYPSLSLARMGDLADQPGDWFSPDWSKTVSCSMRLDLVPGGNTTFREFIPRVIPCFAWSAHQ
jgi:hypothetical protein